MNAHQPTPSPPATPRPPALCITFNGQTIPLSSRTTLEALLTAMGHDCTGMATAVNGEFVARRQRAGCVLEAGDSVTVFRAIVGG